MWGKKKTDFLCKEGLFQALAVALYVGMVVMLMINGERWLGKLDKTTGPILALSLLVTSVMVCGLLVFAIPYRLFLGKKGEEALNLVIATTKWLMVFLILLLLGLWGWR